MLGENAQGPLVSLAIDDEDDDEEKFLFVEFVLAISGSPLPFEVKAKKFMMEDCLDELKVEDLEELVCGTSFCLEDLALY